MPQRTAMIGGRMAEDVDRRLGSPAGQDGCDRRNGTHPPTPPAVQTSDIELEVPRIRRYRPTAVPGSRVRRVPGSTRSSLRLRAWPVHPQDRRDPAAPARAPATVSRVAGIPDAAFHRCPLTDRDKALMPDGVVLAHKTGAGALRQPILVALGILPDGRKGIIDLQPARGESAAKWERPPASIHRRGPAGEGLEMIRVDDGNGLPVALPLVYPDIPIRRCRARRIRNIPNKFRRRATGRTPNAASTTS